VEFALASVATKAQRTLLASTAVPVECGIANAGPFIFDNLPLGEIPAINFDCYRTVQNFQRKD
jgi:hypothetical protein